MAIAGFSLLVPHFAFAAAGSGEAIYAKRCAGCHEQTTARIPHRSALKQLPRSHILRSLDFGAMMSMAYTMTRAERESVAAWLGTAEESPGPPSSAFCGDRTVRLPNTPGEWNGWSPAPTNTRFQPAAAAKLGIDDVRRLRLKWAFSHDGDVTAFAPPTVVGDNLFVGSASGIVYALSASTGCIRWRFVARGPVRTAVVSARTGAQTTLLFGDQTGWFYSVDAATGKLRWKKKVDEHDSTRLTGAAAVHRGVAFVPVASWEETRAIGVDYSCCTFRGSVVALRIRDGAQLWKTYTVPEPKQLGGQRWGPSGAGIWSAPTIDASRGLLYVTTGDNYSSPGTDMSDAVLALDLKSGRIQWSRQLLAGDVYNSACSTKGANCPEEKGPDHDFGASAMLVRGTAGDLLIAGQKSGMVYALSPDNRGEIVWQTRVGSGGLIGGVQWGMASAEGLVFASVSDAAVRPFMDPQAPGVRRLALDPQKGGGLTALRIADGHRSWTAAPTPCPPENTRCSPAQPAAVTAIPGAVFSGSLDGHIRAFSTEDGSLLWQYDTVRAFDAVNGVKGQGGSLDGPGAVIANGMVYVNSGYARFGGMPGNVLLAFTPVGEGSE